MIEQIKEQYGGKVSEARRRLRQDSSAYPKYLVVVPITDDQRDRYLGAGLRRVLRSRDFFVMEVEQKGFIRLTINRADINGEGVWKDGITWDEIQRLKREAGYGERLAVEVYPEDEHFVNDANMRHIFILNERPDFAWTSDNRAKK